MLHLPEPTIDSSAFVAPGTHVYGDVTVGADAVIMFGAVLRAEHDRIVVGARTNIQDNAVVHCDEGIPCRIGEAVTVGHAAVIHGATVGNHCLVGIGASVLNRSTVGEGAWVAAGAVVAEGKAIPAWTLAVGIPAKPLRELTEAEIASQRSGVETYRELAAAYRSLFDRSG